MQIMVLPFVQQEIEPLRCLYNMRKYFVKVNYMKVWKCHNGTHGRVQLAYTNAERREKPFGFIFIVILCINANLQIQKDLILIST